MCASACMDWAASKPQEGRRNTPSIRWMITEYVNRSLLAFSMRKDVSESQQMLSL